MKKAMRPAQGSERLHSIKLAKETLRRMEATGLREAAGGSLTVPSVVCGPTGLQTGSSCFAPCFRD